MHDKWAKIMGINRFAALLHAGNYTALISISTHFQISPEWTNCRKHTLEAGAALHSRANGVWLTPALQEPHPSSGG